MFFSTKSLKDFTGVYAGVVSCWGLAFRGLRLIFLVGTEICDGLLHSFGPVGLWMTTFLLSKWCFSECTGCAPFLWPTKQWRNLKLFLAVLFTCPTPLGNRNVRQFCLSQSSHHFALVQADLDIVQCERRCILSVAESVQTTKKVGWSENMVGSDFYTVTLKFHKKAGSFFQSNLFCSTSSHFSGLNWFHKLKQKFGIHVKAAAGVFMLW